MRGHSIKCRMSPFPFIHSMSSSIPVTTRTPITAHCALLIWNRCELSSYHKAWPMPTAR